MLGNGHVPFGEGASEKDQQWYLVGVLLYDVGTSLLLSAQVHADFHAETALQAVVAFLRTYGLPNQLTFDRDVRWVGSPGQRDFPSALCQFLYGVGVQPNILPPRHPELNDLVAYCTPFRR